MTTLLRRCAYVAGALALVLVLAIDVQVPAFAQTYQHTDARHDVERAPNVDHRPHNRTADITHLRIVHDRQAVRFFVRFRSASMTGLQWRGFVVALNTSGHRYVSSFLLARDGITQHDSLFDLTTSTHVSCRQTVRREGPRYILRFPDSCLHGPRWVRASLTANTSPVNSTREPSDNALSNHWRAARDRHPLSGGELARRPFTPRIHR